jgi:hypothetical protein
MAKRIRPIFTHSCDWSASGKLKPATLLAKREPRALVKVLFSCCGKEMCQLAAGPKRGGLLLLVCVLAVLGTLNSGVESLGSGFTRVEGSLPFGEGAVQTHLVDLGADAGAREFRAALTYSPDSLPLTNGSSTSPPDDVRLSFFITSATVPIALADYRQAPALTLISSTDLVHPLPRYALHQHTVLLVLMWRGLVSDWALREY